MRHGWIILIVVAVIMLGLMLWYYFNKPNIMNIETATFSCGKMLGFTFDYPLFPGFNKPFYIGSNETIPNTGPKTIQCFVALYGNEFGDITILPPAPISIRVVQTIYGNEAASPAFLSPESGGKTNQNGIPYILLPGANNNGYRFFIGAASTVDVILPSITPEGFDEARFWNVVTDSFAKK